MRLTRTLALMPLLAASLLAAGPKFTLQGNVDLVVASGDLAKMTSSASLTGYNVGGGLNIETSPGFGFRLHANMLSIQGVPGSGLEGRKPKHFNMGVDVFKTVDKVTFFGGMGFVDWRQGTATLSSFTDNGGLNNSGKGKKLSGRIGVEYAFTPQIHGVVSFTQTEFNKVYQPAWLGFGVAYRFFSF